MSEAVETPLLLPDDIDHHPPSKKIKLSPEAENSTSSDISNRQNAILEPPNVPQDDDEFDPVQALLEAGKKCQEEEEERRQKATEPSTEKCDEANFVEDSLTTDEVILSSEGETDEESVSEEEVVTNTNPNPPKRDRGKGGTKGKKKSKKKKKSSNMRRNIKDILQHDQLDDLTIAARKEEEERRQRMILKHQQLQQQQLQLRLLQQQQQQLVKESLGGSGAVGHGNYNHNYPYRVGEDLLLKRLMRKKHITVALDANGAPVLNKTDKTEDCILLSSDEEPDNVPSSQSQLPPVPPTPPQQSSHHQSDFNSSFPSHCGIGSDTLTEFHRRVEERKKEETEVIALSSEEEDNGTCKDGLAGKDARFYDGASSICGKEVRGDVDSDDDCVIISPGPADEEEEAEEKDECSQDLLNVPDALGRVLVNVGHPEEDEDIFLPPQIAKIVKPHQIGGIRFLYDNVVESKDRYDKSSGFGCILAHAMGLGKTLQTVAFCDTLLRTAGKTVLIIVPINTIQNWLNEFNRYLPAKQSTSSVADYFGKRRTAKVKSGKKGDVQVEIPSPIKPDGLTSENSKGSEDITLNSSFDSTLTLSNDFNTEENAEAIPTVIPSQAESGISSLSSQDSSSTSGQSDIQYRTFEIYLLNETVKSLDAREKAITTWTNKGGVLLIGYEMYRMLALKRLKKSSRKVMMLDHHERAAEAESLDKIYECLVDPGPDCVICDEGHRIKNSGAGISQALKAIKTKRRVVLTGYPLQNNLMEYWCMVDFVRPNYLGTKAEFSNMFERPIQNGQCADSTHEDKRLMKYRSHVLHSLLEGFVQRRSHIVLRNALPQKEEWVFLVRLTPVQLNIYREFIRYLKEDLESDNASANPIKAFAVCCKIWNHPDVLYNVVKKNLDLEMDLDIDEVTPCSRAKPKPVKRGTGRPRGRPPLNGLSLTAQSIGLDPFGDEPAPMNEPCGKAEISGISLEWAKPLFENYAPEVMENGVKFELLFMLLQDTVQVGDKLLLFSQSLLTLDLIEIFLKRRLDWKKGLEYVRLDGSTAGLEREKLINEFNKSTVQKLFLISTRAGSLGINLVGANRVCIFDASWNPCHDSQAVCRVYRYGQTKPCHIYRFVADCTLEKRIYDRQVNKKGMADRIVDEMNPNTPFKSKDVSSFLVLQHDLLDKLPYIKCDMNIGKFGDPVMCSFLRKIENKITQEPFEHESLLIDQKHQRLSKSEKRLALKNYEKEKKTVANAYATYSRPSYAQYYSSIGTNSSSYSQSSSSSYTATSSCSAQRYSGYQSPMSSSVNGNLGTSSYRSSGSRERPAGDDFERHVSALQSRGITCYPVEIKQDTFLTDPSGGNKDMCIRTGDRVYILVSQKGTYIRIQGKLLRIPFVGTNVNQEQAEAIVKSLLQPPKHGRMSSTPTYPVEQKLPPSNSMLYQKNPNHLQITNSRNNTGGDVMMPGTSTSWSGTQMSEQSSSLPMQQQQTSSSSGEVAASHGISTPPSAPFSLSSDCYSPRHVGLPAPSNPPQCDLQSLSKLETFCHRSSFPFYQSHQPESGRWSASSSSPSKNDQLAATGQSSDLEVIKLNHSQSSNSSNSSNSRTESPYSKGNWNNSNDGSVSGGSAGGAWGKSKDPSFYTDFTITPISSALGNNARPRSQTQLPDNIWDNNSDSRSAISNELLRQNQAHLLAMNNNSSSTTSVSLNNFGLGQAGSILQQSIGAAAATSSTSGQLRDSLLSNGLMGLGMNSQLMGLLGSNLMSDATPSSNSNKDSANTNLRSLLTSKDSFRDILESNLSMYSGLSFNQANSSHSSQF